MQHPAFGITPLIYVCPLRLMAKVSQTETVLCLFYMPESPLNDKPSCNPLGIKWSVNIYMYTLSARKVHHYERY